MSSEENYIPPPPPSDEPQRLSPVPGPPSAPPPADAFDSDSDGAAAPPPALLLEGDDDFLPPPPAEGYTRGTRSESIPPPPPETDSPPSAEAQAGRGINPEGEIDMDNIRRRKWTLLRYWKTQEGKATSPRSRRKIIRGLMRSHRQVGSVVKQSREVKMGHRRGFSQSIEPNQGALLSGIDEEGALSDPEMGEKADEIAAGLGVDLPIPSAIQSASDGGRESTPLPPPPVEDAQASRKRPEAKRSRRKVTHMTFLQFVNETEDGVADDGAEPPAEPAEPPPAQAAEPAPKPTTKSKETRGTPVMLRVQFLIAPEERDLEFGFEPASLQQTTMGFFSGDSVAAVIKRVANKSRVLLKGQEINEAKLGLLLREPVGAGGKNALRWLDNSKSLADNRVQDRCQVMCLPKQQVIRVRFARASRPVQTFTVDATTKTEDLVAFVNRRARLGLAKPIADAEFGLRHCPPSSSSVLREGKWLRPERMLFQQPCWAKIMNLSFRAFFPLDLLPRLEARSSATGEFSAEDKAALALAFRQISEWEDVDQIVENVRDVMLPRVKAQACAIRTYVGTAEGDDFKRNLMTVPKTDRKTTPHQAPPLAEVGRSKAEVLLGRRNSLRSARHVSSTTRSYKGLSRGAQECLSALEEFDVKPTNAMMMYLRLCRGIAVDFPKSRDLDYRIVWFPGGSSQIGMSVQKNCVVSKCQMGLWASSRGVQPGWRILKLGDLPIASYKTYKKVLADAQASDAPFQIVFCVPADMSPVLEKSGLRVRISATRLCLKAGGATGVQPSPYFKVKIAGEEDSKTLLLQTPTIAKNANPSWDEIAIPWSKFKGVDVTASLTLSFELWDASEGLLGNCLVSIGELFQRSAIRPDSAAAASGDGEEAPARVASAEPGYEAAILSSDIDAHTGSKRSRPTRVLSQLLSRGAVKIQVLLREDQWQLVRWAQRRDSGASEVPAAINLSSPDLKIPEGETINPPLTKRRFQPSIVPPPPNGPAPHSRNASMSSAASDESAGSAEGGSQEGWAFEAYDAGLGGDVLIHVLLSRKELMVLPKSGRAPISVPSDRMTRAYEGIPAPYGFRLEIERTPNPKTNAQPRPLSYLFKDKTTLVRCLQALQVLIEQSKPSGLSSVLSRLSTSSSAAGKGDSLELRAKQRAKLIREAAADSDDSSPSGSSRSVRPKRPDRVPVSICCATFNMAKMVLYDNKKKPPKKDKKDKAGKAKSKVEEPTEDPDLPEAKAPEVPSDIFNSGVLEKRGYNNRAFKKRFARVTFSAAARCWTLSYYSSEKAKRPGGVIELKSSTVSKGLQEREFQLLTPQRHWTFRAKTRALCDSWMQTLRWYLENPVAREEQDAKGSAGEPDAGGDAESGAIRAPFAWLPRGYDVYAIALQECKYPQRKGFDTCQEDVLFCLTNHLGRTDYEVVRAMSMWEIRILVVAKRSIARHITSVKSNYVATGVAGVLKNKGGVGIRFSIFGTSVCFVGQHLAARPKRVLERNKNSYTILKELGLGIPGERDLAASHDHMFVLGDLNYRIVGISRKEVLSLASMGKFQDLQRHDQLRKQRARGSVLYGFREMDINFVMTYRYQHDKEDWSLQKLWNLPSYTDRVLYKSKDPSDLKPLRYWYVPKVFGTDHRPVLCAFMLNCYRTLPIPRGIKQKRRGARRSGDGDRNGFWRRHSRLVVTLYGLVLSRMDPELGNEIKVSISNDFTREIVFEPYRLRSRVQMQGAAADVSRMFISSSPATQTGPQKPRKASDTGPSAKDRKRMRLNRRAAARSVPSRAAAGAGGDLEATNPMLMDPSKSPKGGPPSPLEQSTSDISTSVARMVRFDAPAKPAGDASDGPDAQEEEVHLDGVIGAFFRDSRQELDVTEAIQERLVDGMLSFTNEQSLAEALEVDEAGDNQRVGISYRVNGELKEVDLDLQSEPLFVGIPGKRASGDYKSGSSLDSVQEGQSSAGGATLGLPRGRFIPRRGAHQKTVTSIYTGAKKVVSFGGPEMMVIASDCMERCVLRRQVLQVAVTSTDHRQGASDRGYAELPIPPPIFSDESADPQKFGIKFALHGAYRGVMTGWITAHWV